MRRDQIATAWTRLVVEVALPLSSTPEACCSAELAPGAEKVCAHRGCGSHQCRSADGRLVSWVRDRPRLGDLTI